jgi:uncharacterized membrane protein YphA (DoxX/SURF4 family)
MNLIARAAHSARHTIAALEQAQPLAQLGARLFVVNAVAAVSLMEVALAALQQHVFWGSLLTGLVLWGPGRWSIDRFLAPRLLAATPYTRAA